jgi:hypothetical protein
MFAMSRVAVLKAKILYSTLKNAPAHYSASFLAVN